MKEGITLSPKYGVNPTITVCFWCGEDMGVAKLGKLPNDEEAPKRMIMDFTPCDKCQGYMDQGVTVIEATSEPNSYCDKPIADMVFPTSRWSVITHDAASRIYGDDCGNKVAMEPAEYSSVFGTGKEN